MSLNEQATAEVTQYRAYFAEIAVDEKLTQSEKGAAMKNILKSLSSYFMNYAIIGDKDEVRTILRELKSHTPDGDDFADVNKSLEHAAWFNANYYHMGS